MTDTPVNLNRIRKEKSREAAKRQADANAAKFGQTKADRSLAKARAAKAQGTLDAHQRETGE